MNTKKLSTLFLMTTILLSVGAVIMLYGIIDLLSGKSVDPYFFITPTVLMVPQICMSIYSLKKGLFNAQD